MVYSKPLDEVKADTVHSFFQDVADGKIDPTIPEYDDEEADEIYDQVPQEM